MWFFVAGFDVRVAMMFHLIFVHYTLVGLLRGHFLGNSCLLGWPYVPILSICNFYLFPIFVLRAGFGF